MASTTPSPVSHIPGPLNLNYDSDDGMQVDSDSDHPNIHIKEPDLDADGESVDEDASPPPSTVNAAGPSLSHQLGNSVCFHIILHIVPFSMSRILTGPGRLGRPRSLCSSLLYVNFCCRAMRTMETTKTIMTRMTVRTSTVRRRL